MNQDLNPELIPEPLFYLQQLVYGNWAIATALSS